MKCLAPLKPRFSGGWDGHDWVLVSGRGGVALEVMVGGKEQLRLLWACPCGEFKWTSYAEWEETNTPEVQAQPPAKSARELTAEEIIWADAEKLP